MDLVALVHYHPIFTHMSDDEIRQIFNCFQFQQRKFKKDEYIILEGNAVKNVGIIIHGTVLMEKNDLYGNSYFFTELREHEIFGEPFMGEHYEKSSVNYKAMTNCSILFFSYRDIWKTCNKGCNCHMVFIENLMNLLAMKTRSMLTKIEILSKKSLRDRILTFLNLVKTHQDIVGLHHQNSSQDHLNENEVFIPFNRTEMAEYLGVNRSAMVRELSIMQSEHLITFDHHIFTIIT